MSGGQRVQDYLQRHKVGILFEELMSKLVTGMPDEPLVFLNRLLERKIARQARGISPTRRSTSQLGTRKSSPDFMRRSMPTSIEKNVPKSALVSHSNLKKGQKGAVNFEDGVKSGRGISPTKERSYSKLSWQDDVDEDLLYTGRRRKHAINHDDIDNEFTLAKETRKEEKYDPKHLVKSGRYSRFHTSLNHKKELASLAAKQHQMREQAVDSGVETHREVDHDYAVEVIEDLNDLRNEGVQNAKQTGTVRLHRSRVHQSSSEPQVRVSICARCARIMTGESSQPAEGTCYGELPTYDCDVDREFPESAHSARTDEEFESVSQVTGPRYPVWHGDEESKEHKLHRFSAGTPKYSTSKSSFSGNSDLTGHNAFRSTWQPGMQTDSETARHTSRSDRLTFSLDDDLRDKQMKDEEIELRGKGWQIVDSTYDSDATTDATLNRRDYQGAF